MKELRLSIPWARILAQAQPVLQATLRTVEVVVVRRKKGAGGDGRGEEGASSAGSGGGADGAAEPREQQQQPGAGDVGAKGAKSEVGCGRKMQDDGFPFASRALHGTPQSQSTETGRGRQGPCRVGRGAAGVAAVAGEEACDERDAQGGEPDGAIRGGGRGRGRLGLHLVSRRSAAFLLVLVLVFVFGVGRQSFFVTDLPSN